MTLQEFLQTANSDNSLALSEARAYTELSGRIIKSNSLTVYVVQLGLYSVFSDIAATQGHAARDMCMAIIDRLRSEGDFNLIENTPMGVANITMLDNMIVLIPEHSSKLAQLKTMVMAYCNTYEKPFEYVTLHTILNARGVCPMLEDCTPIGNYFVIEATSECEPHSPNLWGQNPRTLAWTAVNRFPLVSGAGRYELPKPSGDFSAYRIDNAYGVITCLKTL